jgi:ribosomal protein S12 methylthiotransferase accessory factor
VRAGSDPGSLRRLLDALDYLVDERTGIIQFVIDTPRQAGSPDFFHYFAQACDTRPFAGRANFGKTGGASADRAVALAKAVGEGVERYCAAIYALEELPLHSFADAPFKCVHPSQFALLSPEQYRLPGILFVPFEEDTPVRWTPALDPLRDEIRHVPAAMVYVPYIYHRGQGDSPIAQSISTGLACHCSYAEAAMSAICEVIERDAFTITWQAMMAHPQIDHETLSPANQHLVGRFERAGYSVTLLDMTMDTGVPTILAVSRSDLEDAPPLVPAGSASLSPEEAVRKSLEELEHTREYSHKIMVHMPPLPDDPNYDNVEEQIDHLNFWCSRRHGELASFLFASGTRRDFEEIEDLSTGTPETDLHILLTKIAAIEHSVLLCDVTTPDIREVGLTVIRAVIPGFHPLVVGHRIRSLGGTRLWTVPKKLGHPGITSAIGDNPAPHPYP